jgi:hypothetical protein
MAEAIKSDVLHGYWVHSHEEDTPTEMVFRPARYPFPPSRGRQGFELRPDGSYVETGPGPADKPQSAVGRWTLEDHNRLALYSAQGRGGGRVLEVTSVAPDRLVIRK